LGVSVKNVIILGILNLKINRMTAQELLNIGFNELPNFNIHNSFIYPLGRHRFLSVASVGTPNEMVFIYESKFDDERQITDLICLHNFDYDGKLSMEKLQNIINAIKTK
jgi:hypothetical protein